MKKEKGVEGKVCVVTGAAGVLCASLTEDLLRHGAKVAVLDLRGDVARKFCADLAKKGLKDTIAIEANVLDKQSLIAARTAVLKKWKRIDVLVNGAGGNHPKGTCSAEQMEKTTPIADSFFGLDQEGFEFVNRLNFIGTLLPCQVFCEAMLKKGGAVLNFCSMACWQPMTKVAAYGAAKAGVMNFTAFLATHLAPMGVRVNSFYPGLIDTDMTHPAVTHEQYGPMMLKGIPLGRFGTVDDCAYAVLYLASDASGFMTGQHLIVDGGALC
jgi:NAD(P)-dependent dehydrogenase (short-subunit alcohol dehydrogenase family)